VIRALRAGSTPPRARTLAPAWRRPLHLAALASVASLLLAAAGASAQTFDSGIGSAPVAGRNDVSSQNAAFELRFGPYSPKIDDNVGSPVYADFFGDTNRFMFGIEADWQAWRAPYIGTLGIGVGWGYTQMAGTNKIQFVVPGEPPPSISQESTLNIMPFYGVGVLRVDTFARNFKVPLVPYAKLGLSWAFWWINDGVGTATTDTGEKGRDVSFGYQASLGGMFLLDILDPGGALSADVDSGVNNSYLFFEWSMSDYGGNQMNVGSSNWVTGLAFEM
jgi:hypothetical protein